ncbi:MAG: S41 family peptidase, partial [Acidobacteriota bacterium]
IYFRSSFEQFISRDPNLYFVGRDGGPIERFPLDRGTLASFSPDGNTLLYCRKGREEYQWKRYRGGQYVDIWSYDFTARRFEPLTDFVGKNAYPMWIAGRMVYVSDASGVSNLWEMPLPKGAPKQLTTYTDSDVMMAESDGARVVYLHDGFVHLFDPATGSDRRVSVTAPSDRWLSRDRVINPKDYVRSADVSSDGTKLAFEARGDVFVVPADAKGQTRNLSDSPGTRELHPRLSPDGATVAFFSDRGGEYQLYTQSVEGGEWTQLTTTLDRFVYRLAWSPDGKKILFGTKDLDLFVVIVESKELIRIPGSRQLKNDEFTWEIDDYAWSPDSRWVAYTQVAPNRNSRVHLWNLQTRTSTPVTSDFYDNIHPTFDGNGDFLYFLSSRNFDVQMDFYEDNHILSAPYRVMAMSLKAGVTPAFLGDEPDAAAKDEGEGDEKPRREEKKPVPPATPIAVDLAGIETRVWPLPVKAGNHFFLDAGRGTVLWASVEDFTEDEYEEIFKPRGATKWTLHVFDVAKKKETTLSEKIASFALSADGRHVVTKADTSWRVSSLTKLAKSRTLGEKVSLERMVYRVETRAEWNQIFTDCWRWYRDFFYDAKMHGHDWKAVGERYRAALPYVSSREELNWLLSQMVGELSVGHAYIGGGDMGPVEEPKSPVFTGMLGADLVADTKANLWRFARIYGPTDVNRDVEAPLVRPDMRIPEGSYLLAIDGMKLTAKDDIWRRLQVTSGQKVSITVADAADGGGARTYHVEPVRSDRTLRLAAWLAGNIRKVEEASGGRLGYMHINAMGSGGIGEFDKFWRAFRYRDGIVIDVRRNSGGWTEYFLIDKLERRQVAYNVLSGMQPFVYPGSVNPRRMYVAVSNEHNGSDGEAFIEHFKAAGLGKVVGVPSWGGLVGIVNGQPTIDGGTIHQPNNSFYGKARQWWVENHGADPDVLVDNDPASVMAGRDLQLEKAIEVLLAEIAKEQQPIPAERPPYPKR